MLYHLIQRKGVITFHKEKMTERKEGGNIWVPAMYKNWVWWGVILFNNIDNKHRFCYICFGWYPGNGFQLKFVDLKAHNPYQHTHTLPHTMLLTDSYMQRSLTMMGNRDKTSTRHVCLSIYYIDSEITKHTEFNLGCLLNEYTGRHFRKRLEYVSWTQKRDPG